MSVRGLTALWRLTARLSIVFCTSLCQAGGQEFEFPGVSMIITCLPIRKEVAALSTQGHARVDNSSGSRGGWVKSKLSSMASAEASRGVRAGKP